MMENPIKIDDLGVPLFLETSNLLPTFKKKAWKHVDNYFCKYVSSNVVNKKHVA